jgi:hypothetical protein
MTLAIIKSGGVAEVYASAGLHWNLPKTSAALAGRLFSRIPRLFAE